VGDDERKKRAKLARRTRLLAAKPPMSAKFSNLPAPPHGDVPPERRERIYLFAVTSAAVFLTALLLVARREEAPVVEAVLARPATDPAGAPTAFPREEDEKFVAADDLRAAIAAAVGQTPDRVGQDVLDHYRRHLTAREREADAGTKRELTLRYEGGLPRGAAVLNELARRYVERHSLRAVEAARQVLEQADRRGRDAQARADEARRVVDAFLNEHLESLQAGAALEAGFHKPSAPGPRRNPQWLELRGNLTGLERQMQDLLAKLNPEHPLAKNLQLEIEQTRRQLAATSETLAVERFARGEPKRGQTQGRRTARQLERYREQKTRYRQLLEVQQQTLTEAARAQAALAAAQSAWRRAQGTRMDIARFAQSSQGSRVPSLTLALVLAVVCGGAAAGSLPADPTFRDQAHAQRVLGVPVFGRVADPTVAAEPRRRPLALRLVRRASELVLLASVVLLIVSVLNGGSVGAVLP
jgi:hypothetical protein